MSPAQTDPKAFLDKKNVIAVVGVSHDASKYGNKVFFDLLRAGYRVLAVHKDGGEIDGAPRYPDLASLPQKPDVVCVVVPPAVTEQVARQCAALGIGRIWMQPGSESEAAIRFCQENGIAALSGVCVMIERRRA